jgi:spectinomycin phosphotransferase
VRDLPPGFDPGTLPEALADGWGFVVSTIDYDAVGFGSYHWRATDRAGRRAFVTVDDLDRKPWLGDTLDEAFAGLARSFDTAVALREAGLEFVVAPITAADGTSVRRIADRYSVALFPFVGGRAGEFGEYETENERVAVARLLAELHRATPAVESIARRIDLRLAGRAGLEAALGDLDRPWSGGPYAERARLALAIRASEVVEVLGLFDRLARDVVDGRAAWVVTHGEPHAANVMRTDAGLALIDWDTVALAPRERDLWMLAGETPDAMTGYAEATGHRPDAVAIDFFRLMWDLADLASFTEVLRSPHDDNDDTAKAYAGLLWCVAVRDRWPSLLA